MSGSLMGKRILVVEDEYFIAADIRRTLQKEGVEVVGPAGGLDAALGLINEAIDGAILDVNLGDTLSYPIADLLRSRSIPYMFLTGYDGWSLPSAYCDAVRLAKPFAMGSFVTMVERLLSPEPGHA